MRTNHRTIWKRINDFIINEGLISSWGNREFTKFLSRIVDRYGLEYRFNIEDETRAVLFDIDGIFDIDRESRKSLFRDISNLLNQSGFYSIRELNLNDFINPKSSKIELELIKKFTEILNVPKIIYHGTSKKYLNKILKVGLIPKSHKVIEDHPERIYFTDSLEACKDFISMKHSINKDRLSKFNREYAIFSINTSGLNIKLYRDALSPDVINFYFTYDNISPKDIELVEEFTL
jgi:hypothetical protein